MVVNPAVDMLYGVINPKNQKSDNRHATLCRSRNGVQERPGRLREFWFYFRETVSLSSGCISLRSSRFMALFALGFAPHDATQQFRARHPTAPRVAGGRQLWKPFLGTDPLRTRYAVALDTWARPLFFLLWGVVGRLQSRRAAGSSSA